MGRISVLVLIFQDATRIFRRAVLRPSFSLGITVLAAGIAFISLPQSRLCGEVASLFGKAHNLLIPIRRFVLQFIEYPVS